jgi:hypothetical protein
MSDIQDPTSPTPGQNLDLEHLQVRSGHLAEQLYQLSGELVSASNRSADLSDSLAGNDLDTRKEFALAHYHNALAIGATLAQVMFTAGQLAGLSVGREAAE